eukprot:SAG11_NODE_252_length_11593_cov_7.436663_3_plen_1076_part_00
MITGRRDGTAAQLPLLHRMMSTVAQIDGAVGTDLTQAQQLETSCLVLILFAWDPNDCIKYEAQIAAARQRAHEEKSSVGGNGPVIAYGLDLVGGAWPVVCFGADHAYDAGKLMYEAATSMLAEAERAPTAEWRARYIVMAWGGFQGFSFFDIIAHLEVFDWEHAFGESGIRMVEASECYTPQMHGPLAQMNSCDLAIYSPILFPMILRWGNLEHTNVMADRALGHLRHRIALSASDQNELYGFCNAIHTWCQVGSLLPSHSSRQELLEVWLELGWDWETIDDMLDATAESLPVLRPRGKNDKNVYFGDVIYESWHLKSLYYSMVAASGEVPATQLVAALPDAAEFLKQAETLDGYAHLPAICWSSALYPALALEAAGAYEAALAYAEAALNTNLAEGGAKTAWVHCLALSLKGRILSACGDKERAAAAFMKGADCAAGVGYTYLEAKNLRELLKLAPPNDSAAVERRLNRALALLVGHPTELLAWLDADGWGHAVDKIESLSHAKTDVTTASGSSARDIIAVEPENSAQEKASPSTEHATQELAQLKMSDLKKRARAAGVTAAQLEAADDSEDPTAALIATLLQSSAVGSDVDPTTSEAAHAAELRAELAELKSSELRKRAVAAGATSADMDAADDSKNPKAFLIEKLVALSSVSEHGEQLSALVGLLCGPDSSEAAASRLGEVLERGAELLDSLLVSTPRKARRSLQQLLDEVDAEAEQIETNGCAQLQQCAAAAVHELAASVLAVEALVITSADENVDDVIQSVKQMLVSIASCGDVVLQSVSVLLNDGVSDAGGSIRALEVLRELERTPEMAEESELSVVSILMEMVLDSLPVIADRETACLALYTVCIRIGRPLASLEYAAGTFVPRCANEIFALCTAKDWQKRRLSFYIKAIVAIMLVCDVSSKAPCPNPLNNMMAEYFKATFQECKKLNTDALTQIVEAAVVAVRLDDDDLVTIGALALTTDSLLVHSSNMVDMAQQHGFFGSVSQFHRTRVGSRLPTKWWVEHSNIMTEQTNRQSAACYAMQALPRSGMKALSLSVVAADWQYMVEESVHILRSVHDGQLTKGEVRAR